MISLLCPSRGRPDRALQFLNSVLETQDNDNEILFALQNDDPAILDYPKEIVDRAIIMSPSTTVYYWNALAAQAKGDLLTLIADDVIMRTKGWDTKFESVKEQYKDDIYLITTQDGRDVPGVAPMQLPTPHPTITRRWYDTLGYLTFPGLFHYYADTWNAKIARSIGRQINMYDVLWEHVKEHDNTRTVMKRNKWAELDEQVFKLCSRHFELDLALIKGKLKC